MKQIIFIAFVAMVIAGIAPRVMSQMGHDPAVAAQPARAAAPAPQQTQTSNYRTVTVQSDRQGHFQVEGSVDGRRLDFMVDTGATVVALRERDAGKLGIFPAARDFTGVSSTANGIVRVAPVRLSSLEVNGIRIYDVNAVIIPDHALSVNLLGMSFLSRVRRFEMANGRLVMEQ
ncbi:MAG: TIGR02281 family clan AA aspartic protease [Alphaproteobacteria bacterium]|nr:TIGR02281 family clan AA aspartic protease [Alphaproteobacteria bacterium]